MALSIGTLVGYLQLDDTQFNRKADAADKKINGLKLHLDALAASNPKLKLEVETDTAKLEALQARIADLKAQSAKGIDVRVDMVAALVELDRLQTKLRAMHNAEIKVHVDDKEALTKLAAIQKAADVLGSHTGGLLGSALAFGPALLPMINAIPGGLFAIGSGAVASAGGVGVLALAFHGLGDAVKAYQTYEAKLPFAKDAKQIAALKKALALSAYGSQNASGREFTRLVATKGADAGSGIKQAAQAGVFPGATKALKDILPLVPTIERLMKSLGHTVGEVTDETAKALNSPFWRQWFKWLGQDASVQLPLVGSIFGHFIEGLMQAIQRFAPQGTSILKWIDDLARRFDNWTGSAEFDQFMATTGQNARIVADALVPLGKVLGEIYSGLSGSGMAELKVFGEVMDGMAHLPPGVFHVLGATLPVIFLTLKGFAAASAISGGIRSIASAFGLLAGEAGAAGGALALLKGGGKAGALGKAGAVPVFVTNPGFAGGAAGAAGGLTAAEGGAAGGGLLAGLKGILTGAGTKSILATGTKMGALGSAAIGAFQLGDMGNEVKHRKVATQAEYDAYKDAQARKKAAEATREQMDAQAGLNRLLLGPALPGYMKLLKSLPPKVQTQVLAPGTIKTGADIKALKQQYDLTPAQVKTLIRLSGVGPAMDQIRGINAAADHAARPRTLSIGVLSHGGRLLQNLLGNGTAEGGTIPGQRMPYGDKVLTPTAPGEEVISNSHGQADKNRAALKAANAGALIGVIGMASGGTVPDPLSGFGPGDVPGTHSSSTSGSHHKKRRGQTRTQKLNAQLAAENKALSQTKSMLAAAQEWSSTFGGNAFAADLPTTKVVPGSVMTSIVNGMKVTQTGASQTVAKSPQEILQSMLAYQAAQKVQAKNLSGWVAKLRKEGVSQNVLDQMKAGGPQGIAEIQALASGSVAQVRKFNADNAATAAYLNNTGALATTGHPYSDLQKDQMAEQKQIRILDQALHHKAIPVRVVASGVRP